MAIGMSRDQVGWWGSIQCDQAGCAEHVAIRPAESGWEPSPAALADVEDILSGWAKDEGWTVTAETDRCAMHRPRTARSAFRPSLVGRGAGQAS